MPSDTLAFITASNVSLNLENAMMLNKFVSGRLYSSLILLDPCNNVVYGVGGWGLDSDLNFKLKNMFSLFLGLYLFILLKKREYTYHLPSMRY